MKNNSKNLHVVVNFHEGGFFSNFNKITTFLSQTQDTIAKITWDLQGQPFGAFAYNCGEVFGKLFENYNSGNKIEEEFILKEYTDTRFTGKNIQDKYAFSDWRQPLHATLNFFKPTPLLQEHQDKIDYSFIFSSNKFNLIGILKRNERLKCEQKNNAMPSLEQYYKQIDALYDENTYLYLSVDNYHDLNAFVSKYKNCIFNSKMRRTAYSHDQEPHFLPGTAHDALHAYLDVYCLSKCQHLIHPVSNMATAALYFNPSLYSINI